MDKLTCTLLVDDDETTNYCNQMLLEDLGVTEKVLIARNGREALELIRQQHRDNGCLELILLDINMPIMDGFEFLKAYQQLDIAQQQSVVIMMLTTSLNPGDIDRLQQAPIQGFLNKPLKEEMVNHILQTYFNQHSPTVRYPTVND